MDFIRQHRAKNFANYGVGGKLLLGAQQGPCDLCFLPSAFFFVFSSQVYHPGWRDMGLRKCVCVRGGVGGTRPAKVPGEELGSSKPYVSQ